MAEEEAKKIEKASEAEVALQSEKTEVEEKEGFAKAGKKSKKHIEEVKAEEERQARKIEAKKAEEAAAEKPKGAKPVTRPLIERRGKKYQAAYKTIEKGKAYSLKEGIEAEIKACPEKFDATVELSVRLGVDPRQADQNIRSTVVLPEGTGKSVKVAVFAPLDEAKKALTAGADIAEDTEFLNRLEKGEIEFDVLISTPAYMPKLGKYARLLGPKGLMPNPKAGTVTTDIEKAVKEAKAGKVEFRVDKQSIIHLGIGKVSFGADRVAKNAEVFLETLKTLKPASLKGQYVVSIFVSTTMGPSVKLENLYK